MSIFTKSKPTPSWRRWFRRTNVYIAEYILMLIMVGAFLGIAAGLWFSFFSLLLNDGTVTSDTIITVAAQVASLIVVAPAMYWLYSRVTGQEMIQPTIEKSKARTVFLTLWTLGAVFSIVGLTVTIVTTLVTTTLGLADDAGFWVRTVVPGILALATFVFGLFMVVKHESRSFTLRSGWIVAILTLTLVVANASMVVIRKDTLEQTQTECTYAAYQDKECTYGEYIDQMTSRYSSDEAPSGAFNSFFKTDFSQ